MIWPAPWRLMVIIGLSVTICIFILIYMLSNNLSLSVLDEYGRGLPMTACILYSVAQVVLGLSCHWTEKVAEEATSISLD